MSYNVYKIKEKIAIPDPDMPQPRYHTYIFIETSPTNKSGIIHQVTGDIVIGMTYEVKEVSNPEQSESFHAKELLGKIRISDYPDALDGVCKACPPPGPQKKYNAKTNRTEPVKTDGAFYVDGEVRGKLVKCTEWTEDQVIPKLWAAGVLRA